MLVLTRKYQEKVRIGDGITITILRAKGKAVRLGIEAPPDVPVIRGELAFHQTPANAAEKSSGDAEPDTEMRRGKTSRDAHAAPAWSTESHPRAGRSTKENRAKTQVTLRRVPREKAAEMLPQLISDRGPLREMLDLRTGTV